MRRLLPNKALLWREWRQNRWWMIGLFWLIIWNLAGSTMVKIASGRLPELYEWYILRSGIPENQVWSVEWASMINGRMFAPATWTLSMNPIEGLAPVAVFFWGVWMITRERMQGRLEFLVSTPVSRREIVVAKFLFGLVPVVLGMTVNGLVAVSAALVKPAAYSVSAVGLWFVYVTSVLLALYGAGFVIAAVTGHLVSAVALSVLYLSLPSIWGELYYMISSTFGDPVYVTLKIALEYLQPLRYLDLYRTGQAEMWYAGALFAAFLIFFFAAIRLFEAAPMERNGQVFVFGNPRMYREVVAPAVLAGLSTFVFINWFWLATDWVMLPVFGLFWLLWGMAARRWVRRRIGKNPEVHHA
ncbi:ABC transporter permease subunit [Staphylospora marina]|uniref:ABC transporter permease subunit n=1 Tax=Staphylospora marina TaxID=2490858 RepID=UPI000F5C14EC|nr:ABC transporter permease subunit [Staphylospora marina]